MRPNGCRLSHSESRGRDLRSETKSGPSVASHNFKRRFRPRPIPLPLPAAPPPVCRPASRCQLPSRRRTAGRRRLGVFARGAGIERCVTPCGATPPPLIWPLSLMPHRLHRCWWRQTSFDLLRCGEVLPVRKWKKCFLALVFVRVFSPFLLTSVCLCPSGSLSQKSLRVLLRRTSSPAAGPTSPS